MYNITFNHEHAKSIYRKVNSLLKSRGQRTLFFEGLSGHEREIGNFALKTRKTLNEYLPLQSRLPGEAGGLECIYWRRIGKAELITFKQLC